ncbi:MAG TPA: hypothetical protein VGG33_00940, partial [Polyangia bacterium]
MNVMPKRVTSTMGALALAALIAGPATASPTSHSFNATTGALNVDYPNYLSKHDIVFNSPVTDPKGALPIGTGRVGGMVWDVATGIAMQLSNVDGS